MIPIKLRNAAVSLLALAVLGVGLTAWPAAHAGEKGTGKSKSDKQLLQGRWEAVSAEKGGEKLPDELLKAIKLQVKGDKIIAEILGETKDVPFKIDPTKKPKTIDLTIDEKVVKGIYELKKDTLKVCAAIDENGDRPKDFKGGEQTLLVTFNRLKSAVKKGTEEKKGKEEGGAIKAADTKEQAKARAQLSGAWTVVAAEKGGMQLPEEILKAIKLKFVGKKIEMEILGETKEGTFQVDPTKKPASIDLTFGGRTALGIYELTKDTLKICGSEPGQDRPTMFQAAGEGQLLVTLKRQAAPKGEDKKKGAAGPRRVRPVLVAAVAQQGALKTASANNLKIIGLAMHAYADTYRGTFPAAAIYSKDGKPLLSWRVAILPFLDQGNLYKQFKLDEPWDSAHNKKLLDKMPKAYAAPGVDTKGPHMTFYRVFSGPGTIFDGKLGQRITAIPDGLSNTILVVEAGEEVPWTKPGLLPYDAGKPLPKLGGVFKDGFTVLLADGSVRFLRRDADVQLLRAAITRNDGQPIDWDKLSQ